MGFSPRLTHPAIIAFAILHIFLWQQGKFRRVLQLIAKRDRAGYRSYFEAAMEKPLKDIVPLWQAYLKATYAQRIDLLQIPGSEIFEDEGACARFLLIKGVSPAPGS